MKALPVPVVVAALLLLMLAWPSLGRYGLWFDEVFSVVQSQTFSSLLAMVRTEENNMLLHYLLLWAWQAAGANSEAAWRAPSLLCSVLALWPLHAAVCRLANPRAAAAACLVFACHYNIVQHAAECRGYALAALWATLVFWQWSRSLGRRDHWPWLLTGLLAGLGTWTHYFALLVPAVLLVAMLWRDGARQPWPALASGALAFTLAALPILLTRPPDGVAQIGWAERPGLNAILGNAWLVFGIDGHAEKPALVLLLLLAAGSQWRQRRRWRGDDSASGLALGLAATFAAVTIESLVAQPALVPRFFTPLAPLSAAVLGMAAARIPRDARALALLGIVVTSVLCTWRIDRLPMPDRYAWRPLTTQLHAQLQPGDAVVVYPAFLRMPVDFYLDRLDPLHALPRSTEIAGGPYRRGSGVEPPPDSAALADLSQRVPGCLWLVTREEQAPYWQRLQRIHAPLLRQQLAASRQLRREFHYDRLRVQCWQR